MTASPRPGRDTRAPSSRRAMLAAALAGVAAAATACTPDRGRRGPAAPTPEGSSSRGPVTLDIVGILVEDLGRSLRFYRSLGLDVPAAPGGDSFRLPMPDGHVLFWETATAVHPFDPTWQLPPPADRRIVLEFGFATAENLDTTYGELVAAGASTRLAPFDQGGGIRYAIVVDPDGNQIALRNPAH